VRAGVRDNSEHVECEEGYHREVGGMGDTGHAGIMGHRGDTEGAGESSDIKDVGLDDVDGGHFYHPAPLGEVVVLLSAGDGDIQCGGHPCSPFQFPVWAWFLEVGDVVSFEDTADFDGFGWCVATVTIDEECDVVSEGLSYCWDELFCSAGPLVLVVAVDLSDADFERAVAVGVP